jgi:hypothetical protein
LILATVAGFGAQQIQAPAITIQRIVATPIAAIITAMRARRASRWTYREN